MRIAIVTQPLMSNYGGLLQNWAMQQSLIKIIPATEVITFDQVDSLAPLYLRFGAKIKRILRKVSASSPHQPATDKFSVFRKKYINATTKAKGLRDFRRFDSKFKPNAIIVGSDQVWRPSMIFNLKANFLEFSKSPIKIAYAASFGTDDTEYTQKQINIARAMIESFKSISVRESHGINLCNIYFSRKAVQVLDPTMLLDSIDYHCIEQPINDCCPSYIFTYILNSTELKRNVVSILTDINKIPELSAYYDKNGNINEKKMSPGQWLWGIRNAQMVVCDSFHGVAFSIIYNIDFIVLLNPERGNSRIISVLEQFGLTDRICNDLSTPKKKIDWRAVNKKREEWISLSIDFLKKSLCQDHQYQ